MKKINDGVPISLLGLTLSVITFLIAFAVLVKTNDIWAAFWTFCACATGFILMADRLVNEKD